MNAVVAKVAVVILVLVLAPASGPAAARGGLATWTCIDRPGVGALASDGVACPGRANPYESAASAAERNRAAWLKRYPDEATFETTRRNVLEQVRAKTPPGEQEAAAARVNRSFDAQLKKLRPLWQRPENP